MRKPALSLLVVIALASGSCERPPQIDRIYLRRSGDASLDITVEGNGHGSFQRNAPHGRSGTFSISPQQFARLVQRAEPFRRQAVPVTDKSLQELFNRQCPKDVPFTYDAGAIYMEWLGPGRDEYYSADLGCDAEKNIARDKELLGILDSLPIPPFAPLT